MSEVARFREEQALREQAARNALEASAIVASHDMIVARMQDRGTLLLALFEDGQGMEALALWENGFFEKFDGHCQI